MKAILIFDLEEDRYQYKCATNGENAARALWDIDQWLRNQVKYNDDLEEDTYDAYDKARSIIRECCTDKGFDLDSIIE